MWVVARDRSLAPPAVAAGAGVVVVGALLALRAAGHTSYATDPVGGAALAGAAVAAAATSVGLSATRHVRAAACARWLAVSLLVYLGAAAWAVGWHAVDHAGSGVAVAIWGTAWLPPLALGQLTASAAVRVDRPRPPWPHVVQVAAVGLAVTANLLLVTATDPFVGVPTIAPESWRPALAPVGLVVTGLAAAAFLLLPALLWRAALTSEDQARARLGVAAAGASASPVAVAFCVLLATAREPGAVEPSLGSVAFLVAVAASTAFAAVCARIAARGAVEPRHLLAVVRGAGLATAALAVVAIGTVLAAPDGGLGATAIAVLVATTTVLLVGGTWVATGRLARVLLTALPVAAMPEAAPAVVPPARVPGLTPRESEVLALVAEGASNAGIAEQLVVSRRTVDAHLRAIFTKLDIAGAGPETNRRVQAARLWLQRATPPT